MGTWLGSPPSEVVKHRIQVLQQQAVKEKAGSNCFPLQSPHRKASGGLVVKRSLLPTWGLPTPSCHGQDLGRIFKLATSSPNAKQLITFPFLLKSPCKYGLKN